MADHVDTPGPNFPDGANPESVPSAPRVIVLDHRGLMLRVFWYVFVGFCILNVGAAIISLQPNGWKEYLGGSCLVLLGMLLLMRGIRLYAQAKGYEARPSV